MAKSTPDDYEAVRIVVATLEPFEANDQERILRWAREKLGLAAVAATSSGEAKPEHTAGEKPPAATAKAPDIKSFIDNKKPQSDSQFAAAVAYYYRFEAPEPQRKDIISAADLQEACRQATWASHSACRERTSSGCDRRAWGSARTDREDYPPGSASWWGRRLTSAIDNRWEPTAPRAVLGRADRG